MSLEGLDQFRTTLTVFLDGRYEVMGKYCMLRNLGYRDKLISSIFPNVYDTVCNE